MGRLFKDSEDHGITQIGRLEHASFEADVLVPMQMHQSEEILTSLFQKLANQF